MWRIVYFVNGQAKDFNEVRYDTYEEAAEKAAEYNKVEALLPADLRREYFAV